MFGQVHSPRYGRLLLKYRTLFLLSLILLACVYLNWRSENSAPFELYQYSLTAEPLPQPEQLLEQQEQPTELEDQSLPHPEQLLPSPDAPLPQPEELPPQPKPILDQPQQVENKKTFPKITNRKYLIVSSIIEGLNVAKTGLMELMYLAKQSGRVLVEPRVARLMKYENSERQLSFGFGEEDKFNAKRSFREYYDLVSVKKTVDVEMITLEEYLEEMSEIDGSSSATIDYQFASPFSSQTKAPACERPDEKRPKLKDKDGWYYFFHGVADAIEKVRPDLLDNWQSKCIPRENSRQAEDAIKYLDLRGDATTVVFSRYVAKGMFVKVPLWTAKLVKSWLYTDRLNKLARDIAGDDLYASFHFRVIKMFAKRMPESQICADRLLGIVTDLLEKQNMKSIYIASDLVPEDDIKVPKLAPYVNFMIKLGEKYRLIESVDRMDIDRDFVDQILCVSSDFFIYASGASPMQERCTTWSSHYTDFILTNRGLAKKSSVNVSPSL